MQTFTDIVAAVVMHSSAAAFSHFGVTLEAHQAAKPVAAERTVARTTLPKTPVKLPRKVKVLDRTSRVADCPEGAQPSHTA